MSLFLGRDLISVIVERWSLLCFELDLRETFDCEETRWLAVVSTESVGQVVF